MHRNVRLDLRTEQGGTARSVRFVTKGRVQKGQPVVTVPDALLVHVPNDWQSDLNLELKGFSDMELLCLYLLQLKYDQDTKWKPYIDMLPTRVDDSAL